MDERRSPPPPKGRGAVSNRAGRFEAEARVSADDGWPGSEPSSQPATVVTDLAIRSILTRNRSPDVPFEQSINPYRGCEHGCIYCFARPNHAFLGLSPGLDFETKLFAKPAAANRLRDVLSKPGYRPRTIMLGTNTDPYQPIERQRRITRAVLEVLLAFRHPVAIATKSALIVRDLPILAALAVHGLVSVGISLTTLDRRLASKLEPRASAPARRLAAIRALADAGIPTAVMAAPLIPKLNDHELEQILKAAAAAGATGASYTLVRLPLELKELFTEWLETHVPHLASRVLASLRECRDGQLYVADFGTRMRGTGVYARLLARRFALACQKLGLSPDIAAFRPLTSTAFRPPAVAAQGPQLWLFGDDLA